MTKYEKRIVAFIDILGFKEIIKKSEKDINQLKLLNEILNYLKTWEKPNNWTLKFVEVEESAQYKSVETFDIKDKSSCTCFSDSIVISIRIDNLNDIDKYFSTLITNLAYIGAKLIQGEILIRGGISYGNLIHDNNGTILGQALIDAYMLESNSAKYPRIILSDKLISQLKYPILSKSDLYPFHQYVERYNDGCVGFSQIKFYEVMQNWVRFNKEHQLTQLSKIRKVIISGLDNSFQNPSVYEKYKWLKTEYNRLHINEEVRKKIMNLNEDIRSGNITYSYTDDYYYKQNEK